MNQVARRNNGGALTAAPNKEPNMTSIPMFEPFDTIVYAKGKDSCLAGRYLGERPIAIHHANPWLDWKCSRDINLSCPSLIPDLIKSQSHQGVKGFPPPWE